MASVLTAAVWAQQAPSPSPDGAGDLAALLGQIPAVAPEGVNGVGPGVAALAEAIQRHGAAAVPAMMERLASPDVRVRRLAGYVVRDLEGLTEAHLDALIAARREGDGWIAPAIGRIGSARAVAFLLEDLRARPELGQTIWALQLTGERGAVGLAQLYQAAKPISAELFDVSAGALAEMGSRAAPAVTILMAAADDLRLNAENRVYAVQALGGMRAVAVTAAPALEELARSDPGRFRRPVEEAIIRIGSPSAIQIIIAQLRTGPSIHRLHDLAQLGDRGRGAGATVVELLAHADWDVRVAAARTLGYIGYAEGTPALETQLGNTADWRIVRAAAESLGRLRAQAAEPALQRVAASYWFLPVRRAAAKAVAAIAGRETYEPSLERPGFFSEFFTERGARDERFAYEHDYSKVPWAPEPGVLTDAQRLAEPYEVEITGYGPDGKDVKRQTEFPRCGLRVPGGVLLGGYRGEWGGELVYKDTRNGKSTKLGGENTIGIHRLPFGFVAVCGLAHLGINRGFLYRIELGEDGAVPQARRWKTLPGAPRKSGVLQSGELYIACVGGDVLISPTGEITTASPTLAGP